MGGRVNHSAMDSVRQKPLNRQLAASPAIGEPHKGVSPRLDCPHARQVTEQVLDLRTAGFDQPKPQVVPLNRVPLEVHHFVDPIAETVRHDQNPGGQRQAGDGEERLGRPPFDIAHRNAKSMRKETAYPGPLDQGRPIIGWRFGSHGLSRWEPGRAAHRAEHSGDRRPGADH